MTSIKASLQMVGQMDLGNRVWQRQDQNRRHLQRFICRWNASRRGRLFFRNGDRFEGEWVAGVRHGQGQLFTAEGRYKQTFEYGIMVSNAPVKTNKSQSAATPKPGQMTLPRLCLNHAEPKPEPPKPQVTVDRKKPQPSNADRDAIIKEIQKNIKDAPKVSAEPKATIVTKTNRNAGAESNLAS